MLKKILMGIGVIVAIILILPFFLPKQFKISRSITIAASTAQVFPLVNEIRTWEKWSPWMKMDPNMVSTYEGPATGEGASHSWKGNHDVGSGRLTIKKSVPNEQILIHMDFFEPMAGVAGAEFSFQPVEPGTIVTWTMTGTNNYFSRLVCLFMNMDKMIGDQFEKGLSDMKKIAEAPQAAQ